MCEAERLGLKVGNTIFLLAGTAELICKNCPMLQCPYKLKDYTRKDYHEATKQRVI